MQVKIGNIQLRPIPVTGGAVQGSLLGVLDHNAVLESIDDIFRQPASKYMDDMTLGERTEKDEPSVVDFDDEKGRERLTFHQRQTQKSIEQLEEQCEIKGLKLND